MDSSVQIRPVESLQSLKTNPGLARRCLSSPGLFRMHSASSRRSSIASKRISTHGIVTIKNSTIMPSVKRWNGKPQSTSDWDGLRKDSELWLPEGDCFVHLHAKGQSRRGPSFCIPRQALKVSRCSALYDQVTAEPSPDRSTAQWHLHLPAPDYVLRRDAFQYHLTTRNFFAFLFGKPLVGTNLGKALVDLQVRLSVYRDGDVDIVEELQGYCEAMGYAEFAHCPDHALGMLYYAEHFQLRELWIDAFTHCVGMNEELCLSSEFEPIEESTKAQITKTYLEVDLHLGKVVRAMASFLETEMSSANLGLSPGARDHLDRFRSFLHGYYVQKHGYWPPMRCDKFNKDLYSAMYRDFQNLYDYLADSESTDSIATLRPASGGICVLQNVQAFDKRHHFEPLPHPLPLVPEAPRVRSQSRRRTFVTARLNSKKHRFEECNAQLKSLLDASNSSDNAVTSSQFVRAYMRFELECCERPGERVSMADARKVRWLLVYGILQMLVYSVRTPKEVRECKKVSYPLCCLATPVLPWMQPTKSQIGSVKSTSSVNLSASSNSSYASAESPGSMIEPDTTISDYFSAERCSPGTKVTNPAVSKAASTALEMPSPLRVNAASNLLRNTSIRSIRRMSLPSFHRRETPSSPSTPPPLDETLFRVYQNALAEAAKLDDIANVEFLDPTPTSVKERPDTSQTIVPKDANRTPVHSKLQIDTARANHELTVHDSPASASSSKKSPNLSPMFSEYSTSGSPLSSAVSSHRHSMCSNGQHSGDSKFQDAVEVLPRTVSRRSSTSSIYSVNIPKTPTSSVPAPSAHDFAQTFSPYEAEDEAILEAEENELIDTFPRVLPRSERRAAQTALYSSCAATASGQTSPVLPSPPPRSALRDATPIAAPPVPEKAARRVQELEDTTNEDSATDDSTAANDSTTEIPIEATSVEERPQTPSTPQKATAPERIGTPLAKRLLGFSVKTPKDKSKDPEHEKDSAKVKSEGFLRGFRFGRT